MQFNKSDTALVVIDPQNDVLSEKGVSWGLVGEASRKTTPLRISPAFSRLRRNRTSGSSSRPTTSTPPTGRGSSAEPSKR